MVEAETVNDLLHFADHCNLYIYIYIYIYICHRPVILHFASFFLHFTWICIKSFYEVSHSVSPNHLPKCNAYPCKSIRNMMQNHWPMK